MTATRWQRWQWDHPFFRVGGGSEDGLFFIKIYGGDYKQRWWFKYIIMPLYRWFNKAHSAKMWFKHRFVKRHRYHLVDTGLEPGYYDEDYRMLCACMSLLCQYIKSSGGAEELDDFTRELRADDTDLDDDLQDVQQKQADKQDEATTIYRWWKFERPADEKRRDELSHELFGKKRRMKTVPVPGNDLHQVVFDPFTDDEEVLHKELNRLEDKIHNDEQTMLHRLIDIRPGLWT